MASFSIMRLMHWTVNLVDCVFKLKTMVCVRIELPTFGLCDCRLTGKVEQLIRLGVFLRLKPILFVNAVKLYFYPLFNCVRIVKQNVNPVTN